MKALGLFIAVVVTVTVASVTAVTLARHRRADDEGLLNLTPKNVTLKDCITKSGKNGSCVLEIWCTSDYKILNGGVIEDTDLRAGSCLSLQWCCEFLNDTSFYNLTSRDNLDPVISQGVKSCTIDGFEGVCAPDDNCDRNKLPGGIIDDQELRMGGCEGQDRCCPLTAFVKSRIKTEGCRLVPDKECPSCVALYRQGGNPHGRSPTGFYCGGVLVGRRVVLTAAACVLAARKHAVWAKIPASGEPQRNYTVEKSLKHPQYNSGTREHDIALMILSEDVVWDAKSDSVNGACLGLRPLLMGQCLAAGFNEKEEIVLTQMTVTNGSCTERGAVYDGACGRTDSTCVVTHGSPVLCASDAGGKLVAGMVRQPCRDGAALLGDISFSADWLNDELAKAGLLASNYTIGL